MPVLPESPREQANRGGISLDQLIALNDEIAALVRAGVPLERGLIDLGGDLPGRLGAISGLLGRRMSRGESLAEALAAEAGGLPPLYRAVVEAGLKAGRLPAALEELARFARSSAELRRAIGLAFVYPLFVLTVAFLFLLVYLTCLFPRLLSAFESFRISLSKGVVWVTTLGGTAHLWGPFVPCILLLLVLLWLSTGRATLLQGGWAWAPLRWTPWMRKLLESARAATFANLLALLVEQQVPLPTGIRLAAEATGDPPLTRAGRETAAAVERGESPRASLGGSKLFPPLLGWLIVTGQRQGNLSAALRHAAETYRHRALRQAELVRIVLPTLVLIAVGASATMLYALTLFVPWVTLLKDLAVG